MRIIRERWIMFGSEVKDEAILLFTEREMAALRKASKILAQAREHADAYYGEDESYEEWPNLVCVEAYLDELVTSDIQRRGYIDANDKPQKRNEKVLGKWPTES